MFDKTNANIYLSNSTKAHDLAMLYLKNQDLSNLSVEQISQKYLDLTNEFERNIVKPDLI